MKRRKFIKGLLLAPVVVAVGPLLTEAEPTKLGGQITKVVIDGNEFNVNPLDNWADMTGIHRLENENDSSLRDRLLFKVKGF